MAAVSTPEGPIRRLFAANKVVAVCAIGAVLYVAHAAFVPIALALLCALVLSGPVEALRRLHVPRGLSAAIILLLTLAAVVGIAELLWLPAQHWFDRAPQDIESVKLKLSPLTHFVTHVETLTSSARNMEHGSVSLASVPSQVVSENAPMLLFDATRAAAITTLAFVVVTLFLLAGGPPMLARMTAAFASDLHSTHVIEVIEKIRLEVGRFYVTTTLINIAFGCVTAGVMAAWGMPNPMLWGTLAGMLNFIPYAGSATTLVVLTVVSLVSFDSLGRVFAVAGSYLVLTTVIGQVVQPLLVGRRLQVNPLLVFLALWFFGIFWGLAGIILSTPVLVACKVFAENADRGKALLIFLGPEQASSPLLSRIRRL